MSYFYSIFSVDLLLYVYISKCSSFPDLCFTVSIFYLSTHVTTQQVLTQLLSEPSFERINFGSANGVDSVILCLIGHQVVDCVVFPSILTLSEQGKDQKTNSSSF